MNYELPTPHIGARKGEIAETVIMAGDPLRAKFMAERFLDNPVQFNNVRGMLGFTGTVKADIGADASQRQEQIGADASQRRKTPLKRVSVMGHGMGMPSIGIYTYELFNFYDVNTIIRVGSAGSINENLHVGDLVLAMGACTNSNYVAQYELPGQYAPIANFDMLREAANACDRFGYHYMVGNVLSSDTFYSDNPHTDRWINMGVLAVEMEIAALYMNAVRAGKRALGICTISDSILTGEAATAEERQTTFTHMMDVAFSLIH